MASDEIVWQVINQQFCAYKLKFARPRKNQTASLFTDQRCRTTKARTFCRNEHNVTGLCNRQSCPLANSRYATVRPDPESGLLYLHVKTIERSHLPSRLWERTKLSPHYAKALEQIDAKLLYWPPYLIHKCKQRLTRLTQVALRTRRLAKEDARIGERVVPKLAPKIRRREETRERKAEAAAKVERAIERELIERLRSGAYGDQPLNVDEDVWQKVLRGLERQGEAVGDRDRDEGIEADEDEGEGEVEYVSDFEESEEEEDMEELEEWLGERIRQGEDESEVSDGEETGDDENGEAESGSSEEVSATRTAPGGKRKRREPLPTSRKKGPRMEIGYEDEEDEYALDDRQAVLAA